MATRGAKGGYDDNPSDTTKAKKLKELPTITMKKMTKDSVAIARTAQGDTIWKNTGSRSKGGVFWHPKDESGKPKDRRYLEGKNKAAAQGDE